MKTSKELRDLAWESMSGKWGISIFVMVLYLIITLIAVNVPVLGPLLISGPIMFGICYMYLDSYRGGDIALSSMFDVFKDYGRVLGTYLLTFVYIMLWGMLLVVPGIIKAYAYAMTPFILHDNPELKNDAAIVKSMAMMEGHKMELFVLHLTFIGWLLLCVVTSGFASFFVMPYMYSANAAFYEELKKGEGETA